jgi:hypothetical protein
MSMLNVEISADRVVTQTLHDVGFAEILDIISLARNGQIDIGDGKPSAVT